MSLGNTMLQLFCFYYSWCLYRQCQCLIYFTFTLVLSEVCVQCPVWPFSLVSWLHDFLVCCSRIFWMRVPVAPIITGITFVFTFHMRRISIVRSLCFRIFSASFLITFLSPEIATSINIHVPFSLSRIIISRLLLGIVLSVCTCWFHNMVTLPPWLLSTDFSTCSYRCFLSSCYAVSLHMLKCSCAHT